MCHIERSTLGDGEDSDIFLIMENIAHDQLIGGEEVRDHHEHHLRRGYQLRVERYNQLNAGNPVQVNEISTTSEVITDSIPSQNENPETVDVALVIQHANNNLNDSDADNEDINNNEVGGNLNANNHNDQAFNEILPLIENMANLNQASPPDNRNNNYFGGVGGVNQLIHSVNNNFFPGVGNPGPGLLPTPNIPPFDYTPWLSSHSSYSALLSFLNCSICSSYLPLLTLLQQQYANYQNIHDLSLQLHRIDEMSNSRCSCNVLSMAIPPFQRYHQESLHYFNNPNLLNAAGFPPSNINGNQPLYYLPMLPPMMYL